VSAEIIGFAAGIAILILINFLQLQVSKRSRCDAHGELVEAIKQQWLILRRLERILVSQGIDPAKLDD
jgi:hypothetical protein